MRHSISYISILNEVVAQSEILEVAKIKLQQKLTDWQYAFYSFITEWFNDLPYIEVKTSGSTGEPKTIQLPKLVMQKSAERTIQYFGLVETDRLFLSLSCNYIAGKMMVVRALTGNMNLIVVDPSSDFSFLENEKYDFGALVPMQAGKILETENGTMKLENIRHLLIGGSGVPPQLEEKIGQLKSNIVSTYGMTETASHIAIRGISATNYAENYHCLSGISIRKNKDECLEILAEEQAEWLSTTDLVEIISANEFRIIGRADHAIISGGLKFHPELLEAKLGREIKYPIMITAEPDKKLGQKLVLQVECIYSAEFETELLKKIESILTNYERPRKIEFVDRLPRNENGKIVRSQTNHKKSFSEVQDEKKYFEIFRNLHPLLAGGRILKYNEKRKWPDVEYYTQDNKLISIELTRLLHKKTDKYYEGIQNNLENQLLNKVLQNLIHRNDTFHFGIDLSLNIRSRLNKNEINSLALLISNKIEEKIIGEAVDKFNSIEIDSDELKNNNIDRIKLYFLKKMKSNFGNIGEGTFVKEYDLEEIKNIITKKNKILIRELQKDNIFSENWLLIVQTEEPQTWRDNIGKLESINYKSKYDKVLIFDYLNGFFYEIPFNI